MQKSLLTLFCALCALSFVPSSVRATDQVTIGGDQTPITSYSLPISINATSDVSTGAYYAVSQQIYLASELGSGTAKKISAVKFQYVGASNLSRNLEVYLMETNLSGFPSTSFIANANDEAGDKVYDGAVLLTASTDVTITFDQDFEWNGSKNIVLTIYDKTGRKDYPRNGFNIFATNAEGGNRFVFKRCNAAIMNVYNGWSMDAVSSITADSQSNYKYANIITFIFAEEDPEPPATPTNFSVSAVSLNSATLSWSSSYSATSYDLQQSANGEDWTTLSSGETGTSYNWTGLSAASTQYARICANNAAGSSEWSDAVTVTTDAVHEHNGIIFSKWTSTNSLPAEGGDYYLNADVVLPNYYTVPGNINLCLNGHSIYTYYFNIVVPNEKTLAVYDKVGGGRIYGYYVGDNSSYYGLVSVADGGTFVLNGGSVENLANDFNNALEVSYGIYNNGTLKLSGDPVIIGYHGDIYLASSKYITIDSGKPLTNTTPYSLFKLTIGPFTIGWSNMSGAKPSAFFTPKSASQGVCYNSGIGEAEIVRMFSTSDNNESIKSDLEDGTYQGQLLNFKITSRSFTSAQYNTICLPFALSNAQLEDVFGVGYDLEEFDHSNLVGDALELVFERKYSLIEGEPYLIKPTVDVVNPIFDGVTFYISEPGQDDLDEYIDFQGTFGPTSLEGGNRNLLFLGEGNELFWPEATGNIKGFRAYFEVKGAAQNAAKRARIVKKEDSATGIDQITNDKSPMTNKIIKDNQLLILRDNKTYNVIGQMVK